jgi:hypothetical protein
MPRVYQGFIILLGFIFCVNAFAQDAAAPAASVKIDSNSVKEEKKSPLSIGLSMSSSANVEADKYTGRAYSNSYSASLGYKLPSEHSISLASEMEHSLTPIEEFSMQSLILGLRLKSYELVNKVTVAPGASISFPVNEDSVKDDSYLGSVSGSVKLNSKINSLLSVTYAPALKFNNHQFTSTAAGQFNTRYSLAQTADIDINLTDKLGLNLNVIQSTLWNYNDFSKSKTTFSQELSLQLSKQIAVSLGHSNDSSNLATNGKDQNFDFFNQVNSVVYASISVSN